jgi:hypothetical protein
MPIDLKAPLDAVNAAREARDLVAADVAKWLAEKAGTDEMTTEALALQNKALDEAEQKYSDLLATYDKLVKANQPSDTAKLFVPAASTPEAEKPKDVMTLAEYNALLPQDRLAFAKRGGKLEN